MNGREGATLGGVAFEEDIKVLLEIRLFIGSLANHTVLEWVIIKDDLKIELE